MEIVFERVSHIYHPGTPFSRAALFDVDLTIASGSVVAVMGETGSGKTTFAQLAAGLERPTSGRVVIGGALLGPREKLPPDVRRRIGYAFQHPEHQLFEETVAKDVAFVLKSLRLSPEETRARVERALLDVGLDPERYADRSPFFLSGGEKRRVALAGVLVAEPALIVFDEPTAGLDPEAQEQLLERLVAWTRSRRPTVLYITHQLDEALRLAERVLVFYRGRLVHDLKPEDVIRRIDALKAYGLEPSPLVETIHALARRRPDILDAPPRTLPALLQWIRSEANRFGRTPAGGTREDDGIPGAPGGPGRFFGKGEQSGEEGCG
ncbi:MAG: energy-coupling factor transporter ATPase [Hydrogenibacillus sp.]|nr:energy-coupling factor transporter ATPase [Hydrogenibacillus sp.]